MATYIPQYPLQVMTLLNLSMAGSLWAKNPTLKKQFA